MLVKCTIVSLGKAMVYDCIHLYLFVMHANSYTQKSIKYFVYLQRSIQDLQKFCFLTVQDMLGYNRRCISLLGPRLCINSKSDILEL